MAAPPEIAVHRGFSASRDPAIAAEELYRAIGKPGVSFATFYCTAEYDLPALARELHARFGDMPLIGCTSAGEINPTGYTDGSLTGVSIVSDQLTAEIDLIDSLDSFVLSRGEQTAHNLLNRFLQRGVTPTSANTFALVLIDGLSGQEEPLVFALSRALGGMQLFGGSAGDDGRFKQTWIYYRGAFHEHSAIVALMHTTLPFMVFKTQHFESTDQRLVVTRADPATRTVYEINGEPAAREYARVLGLSLDRLQADVFAVHPVAVRIGGTLYVRSIMHANPDESLTFACAINEGIVVSVAKGLDLLADLEALFADIRERLGPPALVLACDCLFRKMEMDQRGLRGAVGEVLARNQVIGFATYGEQFNGMHVNQTFTGVALGYPRAA
ncbi:MAG: FIST domain containing protein [Candidatus Eisenbacteria bacterium]|uniref:FIST domain containing protein n=1 Tax=Eiseniibacteriota bacterium TaxID=2212470 RepID=A0A849SI94_UNCEI|nr:FIST domain containing protein [Candidatus Eisenbacteria bacterium]